MKTPNVVSLFSGCGGLDLGLEAAGYRSAVTLEMDRTCCETLRANRRWPVIEGDIHEIRSDQILEAAGLGVGEVDLLVGGPPCQPFSKSAYWAQGDTKRLDDPRADTLTAYLRVLRDIQPRAFLLENVQGLAYKNKDEGLQLLLSVTEAINEEIGTDYRINRKVIQAADYGVPQLRERVILVGARDGSSFGFPAPLFVDLEKVRPSLQGLLAGHRTAWDALGDLAEPEEDLTVGGKWADLLPSIPEGHNYLWHTDRQGGQNLFGWRTRYWSFLLKLAKSRPSWTIQAQPGSAIGPFHWNSRKLSVRESCRLQTIPDDYRIVGGRTAAQRQLGNAVPSLMAEVLGRAIRKQLLRDVSMEDDPLRLLPPDRSPAPAATKPTEVPAKYLAGIGDYAPHPGTGKGHKARSRSATT